MEASKQTHELVLKRLDDLATLVKAKIDGKLPVPHNPHTNKRAGPVKSVKAKQAVLASLAQGATVQAACKAARIGRRSYYDWRASDPDFTAEADKALAARIGVVEDALFRAASEPDNSGKTNVTAAIFFLCNRAPERWRNVNKVEVSNEPDGEAKRDWGMVHRLLEYAHELNEENFRYLNEIGKLARERDALRGRGGNPIGARATGCPTGQLPAAAASPGQGHE